jgi:hypothetical protein
MYSLNERFLDFSILTIPPGFSIEFLAVGKNEIKTQGGDAGLASGNKKFYCTDCQMFMFKDILDDMEKNMYYDADFFNKNKYLFSILNIRYFILREDVKPISSKYAYAYNISNIKIAINKSMIFKSISTEDYITVLENERFLPHVYAPQAIITSNQSIDALPTIVSQPDYNIRSVILFEVQNKNKTEVLHDIPSKINSTPMIEFKKINPTKYRIRVHSASDSFPLVFSESFHDGWKLYLIKSTETKIDPGILGKYKILDGNGEDQAKEEEILDFVKNGLVTVLGHGEFISKNFQGTIQNNNLPTGEIYETWFMKPIENNENHLLANGYANSWIINPAKLCRQDNKCIKNKDGSYDFEIVVEFWPQRLFYIGLMISGITLLTFIGYLIYD